MRDIHDVLADGRRFNSASYVNLTPHTITVYGENEPGIREVLFEIEPSGTVARVSTVDVEHPMLDIYPGIYVVTSTFGPVKGLPDPDPESDGEKRLHIVSRMVLDALPEPRIDVIAPDTGPTAVRDDKGRILGVTRFVSRI